MKRLLIISQNYYPEIGSAANRIKNIRKLLVEDEYDVTVLTTEPSYPYRNLYTDQSYWNDNDNEENVYRVKPKVRKYTRNMLNRLLLYLEVTIKIILIIFKLEKKFDYIFVSSPPIFMGIAGLVAKRHLKKPLILDVRDLWPESLLGVGVFTHKPLLGLAYYLEKILYKGADRIIVNSESFKAYITLKGIDPDKIDFMPNSLTEEELSLSKVQQPESKQISVVYTGNIGLAQDLQKFVGVAENFKGNNNVKFKIIGYGYKKSNIKNLIGEKELDNIELHNPKSRKDTLIEVAKSDIAYVSLAEKEVFKTVLPGKIIDYMCMKKPIIGDVSGYCGEIIKDANCGLISEDRNIDQLSKLVSELADNQELRKQLGENGFNYAYNKLRWKKNIQVLGNVLEELNEEEGLHVRMESLHK
jgi:glycosyltransferase involved in cell wall biosynthesis